MIFFGHLIYLIFPFFFFIIHYTRFSLLYYMLITVFSICSHLRLFQFHLHFYEVLVFPFYFFAELCNACFISSFFHHFLSYFISALLSFPINNCFVFPLFICSVKLFCDQCPNLNLIKIHCSFFLHLCTDAVIASFGNHFIDSVWFS